MRPFRSNRSGCAELRAQSVVPIIAIERTQRSQKGYRITKSGLDGQLNTPVPIERLQRVVTFRSPQVAITENAAPNALESRTPAG